MDILTEERQEYILNLLKTTKTIHVQDLIVDLEVSESTIRRDLSDLEDQGLLIRIHGGAKRAYNLEIDNSLQDKLLLNSEHKTQIAKEAAHLVNDHEYIYLDAGSTTFAMIPHLKERIGITVVTNGISHAQELSKFKVRTILLGGFIKGNTDAIIGPDALSQLKNYHFHKAFIGMNGVDLDYGFTTPDVEEAEVKKQAAKNSNQCYVVVDRNKFHQVGFAKVMDLDQAIIITNSLEKKLSDSLSKITHFKEVKE